MPKDNQPTEDQYDIYGRGYAAGLKKGADLAYEQCADEIADLKADHAAEIADLKAKLNAAYAEDKPTQPHTWSETYAETLLRHGEDEAVS